jgi:hypothetical protein
MIRCAICPDLVRPEDDFTRDDQGHFMHMDCLEEEPQYPFWLMGIASHVEL